MTRVRIPPTLRAEAGGSREVEIAGETVGHVLDALVQAFPGLDGRLLHDGAIQPFLNAYLDGTDIRALEGLGTRVQPGSTLLLLPAMAGGSQSPAEANAASQAASTTTGVRAGGGWGWQATVPIAS